MYLIQDDVSYHKKPEGLASLAGHHRQIEVFPLPAYSPDFNATERLWHYTRKQSTHNRYFDCPAALCQALFTTFTDMQRHPVKSQEPSTASFGSEGVILFIRGHVEQREPHRAVAASRTCRPALYG